MQAFVDESTQRRYLLVAATVGLRDLAEVRRRIRGLTLPGQRRIHFKKETDARRGKIIRTVVATTVEAMVYDGGKQDPHVARPACLEQLAADLADKGTFRLVLEQDDSLVSADRRVLYRAVHKAGCADTLQYLHLRAYEEPLLGLPDAIAWCWAKGGAWRGIVEPIVGRVRRL